MTAPLSSFSGIASGFQYRDLVDAIIANDMIAANRARAASENVRSQLGAIETYRGLLGDLQSSTSALRDGTAFEAMSAVVMDLTGTSPLVGAGADPAAVPASYRLEVTALAGAQKLSSLAQTDPSAALGLAGSFTVNGIDVTIASGDTLEDVRDAINATNAGTDPSQASASILKVDDTTYHLVITSDETGAAGMTLADTSGTVLQSLGYLDGVGAIQPSAVLVAGQDAAFEIDNIAFTRSTNTVDDAIEGVTLTLRAANPAGVTQVTIDRHVDSARGAAQTFVDRYNALIDFLKEQSTATEESKPLLYGESLIRVPRSLMPQTMLTEIFGADLSLDTASEAGLSFDQHGHLSIDSAKFDAAFSTQFTDLKALFMERREASDASVSLTLAGPVAAAGAYAIDITTAASQAQVTSVGFSGTYDDGGTADTITITDDNIGQIADIVLTTGMTTSDIVDAINTAVVAAGLNITASASGTEVQLTHGNYGSGAGITVVNTAGGGDGASELWTTLDTATGVDVAGTIGGHAATGAGQQLVADDDTAVAGMTIKYSGATTGPTGDVTLYLGTGALLDRFLDSSLDVNTGTIDTKVELLNQRMTNYEDRALGIENRLEVKRDRLLRQYAAMEVAIAQLQAQSASLLALSQSSSTENNG